MNARVTVEFAGQKVVMELEEFSMQETRDLINDYDSDGTRINIRENPANPGVMVKIVGRRLKKAERVSV